MLWVRISIRTRCTTLCDNKKIINLCRKSNIWSKNKKGTNTKSEDELKFSERVDSWQIEDLSFVCLQFANCLPFLRTWVHPTSDKREVFNLPTVYPFWELEFIPHQTNERSSICQLSTLSENLRERVDSWQIEDLSFVWCEMNLSSQKG
jgi:hypothetical protein